MRVQTSPCFVSGSCTQPELCEQQVSGWTFFLTALQWVQNCSPNHQQWLRPYRLQWTESPDHWTARNSKNLLGRWVPQGPQAWLCSFLFSRVKTMICAFSVLKPGTSVLVFSGILLGDYSSRHLMERLLEAATLYALTLTILSQLSLPPHWPPQPYGFLH